MFRMPMWRLCALLIFLASMATAPGCSGDSAPKIDPKLVMQKASGGEGKARQSAKAKADSEEAAKKHPKLY